MTASSVGIVVIGRNEGERLVRCLESVRGKGRVVYVDSGSTDGSVAQARELDAEVMELDLSRPFTAARARNAGFARLREIEPKVEFVQFVDGDCEVRDGWLAAGAAALAVDGQIAAVCGRLRERYPERSIYNRMCDIGWDYPIGEIESCGGNAMYRAGAFAAVSGFCEHLIAGEEFELCSRLRKAGGRVRRIDAEMAWHDVGITRFGQWWKRAVRSGFGTAEACTLYDGLTGRVHRRRLQRAILWGAAAPLALFGAIAASIWIPMMAIAAATLLVVWISNLARQVMREARVRRDWTLSLWIVGFSAVGKVAEFQGVIEYWRRRLTRSRARIIEYRGGTATATST